MLNGRFITGSDVGISPNDVLYMHRHSDHIVGSKVDPVRYTVEGLLQGISVVLKEVFGSSEMTERSFAIQGLGKIGETFLSKIYGKAKDIYVTDVNNDQLKRIAKLYPKVHIVSPEEIHKQKVDVFSPCALSGCLNAQTVKEIRAAIVAGAANNQLEDNDIGDILNEKGILYAPDYVINAGGLISVVDEYEHGRPQDARIMEKVHGIKTTLSGLLVQARENKLPLHRVANQVAVDKINRLFKTDVYSS
jgi:leucine dehydrogenase